MAEEEQVEYELVIVKLLNFLAIIVPYEKVPIPADKGSECM